MIANIAITQFLTKLRSGHRRTYLEGVNFSNSVRELVPIRPYNYGAI